MDRKAGGVYVSVQSKGIQMKRKVKVMTVREVSAYLHVHPSTIYKLVKHHQIPAFRIGSDWRFNIDTIDHWRRQQEKPGN